MKYYFCFELDELMCFPLRYIKETLKDLDLDEVEVIEAKILTGEGLYFCDEYRQSAKHQKVIAVKPAKNIAREMVKMAGAGILKTHTNQLKKVKS